MVESRLTSSIRRPRRERRGRFAAREQASDWLDRSTDAGEALGVRVEDAARPVRRRPAAGDQMRHGFGVLSQDERLLLRVERVLGLEPQLVGTGPQVDGERAPLNAWSDL